MTAAITPQRSLAELEAVIERGVQTFIAVGEALLEVRDGRLYRETHATFEDYCRDRWKFSRQRAAQFIAASSAVLGMSTMVDIPSSERQARELAKITDVVERVAVWRQACEDHGGTPTAADIYTTRLLQRSALKLANTAARLQLREQIHLGRFGADALATWDKKATRKASELYRVWDRDPGWFEWLDREYGVSRPLACVCLALTTLSRDEVDLHFTLLTAPDAVLTTGSLLREAAVWRQPGPDALFYEEAAEMAEQRDAEREENQSRIAAEFDAIPGVEEMSFDEIFAAIASRSHRHAAAGKG